MCLTLLLKLKVCRIPVAASLPLLDLLDGLDILLGRLVAHVTNVVVGARGPVL